MTIAAVLLGFVMNLQSTTPSPSTTLPELPWTVTYGPGSEVCPSALALKQRVADRLHQFSQRAQQVKFGITFVRLPDKFTARIERSDSADGRLSVRELRSTKTSCDELGSAVVLALSVALSDDVLGATSSAEATSLPPETNVQQFSETPEFPLYRRARPNPWGLRVGGGAQLSFGSAPGVAPGFALFVGAERPRWSFDLEGRADIPASQLTPAGGQVSVAWYGASVVPCYRIRWFAGCIPIFLGAQVTQGLGSAAEAQPTFVGASGIRLAARAAATAMTYVEFSLDVNFPWRRIVVDSFETLPVVTTLRLTFYGVIARRP